MNTAESCYTRKLLGSGRGVVAWQRLARFRRAVREIQQHFGGKRPGLLIDVGAADGIALPYWAPIADHVIGVNVYHSWSTDLRQNHPDRWAVTCDGRCLAFPDGSVDVLICQEVLHFLWRTDDLTKCLADFRRVLSDRGVFVCSVPVEVGIPGAIKYVGRKAAGIPLEGMTFPVMLKHLFYPCFEISHYDRGEMVGFNAHQFARRTAVHFRIKRRIGIPVRYPFSTSLMLICTRAT